MCGQSGIQLLSTGPYTPWPNRVEVAVRAVKANLHDMCSQLEFSPELQGITPKGLLRRTARAINALVTYGGKNQVKLVVLADNL